MHLLSMWYLVRLYFLFICMLWWQRMWDKNSQKEREREKEKSLTIECVRVCWEAIPNIKMQGLLLAIAIFFLCLFYSISPNAEHKQTHNFPRCSCSHKGQSCLAFYDLFLAFDHNGKRCHWRDIWWESNHVNICWIQIPFSLVLNCVLTQIIIIKGVICAFCANFDELFLTNIDLIRYLQQKQCANDEAFLSVNGVFFSFGVILMRFNGNLYITVVTVDLVTGVLLSTDLITIDHMFEMSYREVILLKFYQTVNLYTIGLLCHY